MDLLQGEHPQILAGREVGYGKIVPRHTKRLNISETAGDRALVPIDHE